MTIQPRTVEELQDAVLRHDTLTIRGGSTKCAAANGRDHVAILDVSALAGIIQYSADECVFTALAGTRLHEIETRLQAHGQYLPFDPPLVAAGATLGGTVASGLSGSGRYRYGGVRDFVIGVRIVDGEGRLIRSGGSVVKNAAGFLLHHLMVGSLGRFGVLVEISMKVFPAPETRATLRARYDGSTRARSAVHALEAARFDLDSVDFDGSGTLWIRVAGCAEAMDARLSRIRQVLADVGGQPPLAIETLDGERERQVWDHAREFQWVPRHASLVKLPVTSKALRDLRELEHLVTAVRYTSGGAVAWLAGGEGSMLSKRLAAMSLTGLIVRGPSAGTLIGLIEGNVFEERVRRALDPRNRFSAAPDS